MTVTINSHDRVVALAKDYLVGLQSRITQAIEDKDGQAQFLVDAWEKGPEEQLQGNGITKILENGAVFERAGCGFSHVRGQKLPPSATQHRPELAGAPFEAMGVSLVFHPRNPYVPTVHMNVRMIAATPVGGQTVTWFGGGMDRRPITDSPRTLFTFIKPVTTHSRPLVRASTQGLKRGATTISASNIDKSSAASAVSFSMIFLSSVSSAVLTCCEASEMPCCPLICPSSRGA